MKKIKPCPFCGGTITFNVTDDEGNIHDEDYINEPWSGLWFEIVHRAEDYPECVIAKPYGESLTGTGYPNKEAAIAKWNKRAKIYDEK